MTNGCTMNDQSTLPSLVVVGNGMVASRFLDEVLARHGQAYRITVIGAEPEGSYNRIMLSSVLAKDTSPQSIVLKDHHWYDDHNIAFMPGSTVTRIDRQQKFVETAQAERVEYDQLVIATGSSAATIPARNLDLKNVFTFRTLADTHTMMKVATGAKHALVVGGGLLGLEAAYGLAKFGIEVTLVHRSAWLLNRQLDKAASEMLQAVMASMNIRFVLKDEVESFNGTEHVESVTLKSGRQFDIEMAVIATGIKPNAALGIEAELAGNRAIQVDDYMRTSDPYISAIGECIEHNGETFGLVDPLWRQAETLAARLVENSLLAFENSAIATKLKVSGVQVFSAGEVESRAEYRSLTISDKRAKIYRKLLIENNRIVGIVLFGDVRSGQYYFELMQSQTDVSQLLPALIFGEAYLPAPETQSSAA